MHTNHAPSSELVALRLAKLKAAGLPWLRRDVDLTPPDGGPELLGPTVYRPALS